MKTRSDLIQKLETYSTSFEKEKAFVSRFLDLLKFKRCYHRDHLPGHITGSAWIVNENKTHVLLVHHAKLNKWLQPGGHADGDENILNVALREAEEETGLKKLTLLSPSPFDIDIHTIPSRQDFPEHQHYDVRFIFAADEKEPLQLSHESHDLQWVKMNQVTGYSQFNQSIERMVEKTISR